MPRSLLCGLALALAAPLAAQNIDTLGGTNSAPSGGNRAKASMFNVDTTVLVLDLEMYLNVPGPETLTFFAYRHHSRTGTASLEWVHPVAVDGTGVGPAWYSTGPIALELVCGNTYLIGVAWAGTLTYYYRTNSTPFAVSFGTWQRANTLTNPPPATYIFPTGIDVAVYHQRLTTVATASVECIGTGCSSAARTPRLVASAPMVRGNTTRFHVLGTAPTAPAYLLFAQATLPAPVPLFGCSFWIDPTSYLTTAGPLTTSATGETSIGIPIGQDPALAGFPLSVQSLVVIDLATATLDFTGALDLVVQ